MNEIKMFGFNFQKKYKRAPNALYVAKRKAEEKAEDLYIKKVCDCPKNYTRFSSLTQKVQEKLARKEVKVIYKFTTGKSGFAKLVGFTFFPFQGGYPTLKAGKDEFSLDERKIFIKNSDLKGAKK